MSASYVQIGLHKYLPPSLWIGILFHESTQNSSLYSSVGNLYSFNLGKLTKLRFLKKITLFCPLVEQQSIFSSITVHGMIFIITIIILNTSPKTI